MPVLTEVSEMKAAAPREMNAIDRISIEKFGIPGIVLMENAALKVADEACRMLGDVAGKSVLVIAGKGNNGGDAFAAARHLFQRKAQVMVFLSCNPDDIGGDARINYTILQKLGIPVEVVADEADLQQLRHELAKCNLVIDGLFGTGFRGEVAGISASVIRAVNDSAARVLSIDIPSGVDGETGRASSACIKADTTVTFGLPKTGLLVHPGCEYAGRLLVADIGLPEAAVNEVAISRCLSEAGEIRALLPGRKTDSNKGSYGKVLIVAGSKGMTGAASLAATACLRSGAGLVYLAGPASLVPVFSTLVAEAVVIPMEDGGKGVLSAECIEEIKKRIDSVDAVAVGPGLTVCNDTLRVVEEIIGTASVPVVIDADGLNSISRDINMLKKLKAPAVITPHPGEMARLTGKTIDEIQGDRINTAADFAAKWNVTVVLKGARTITAAPDGRVFINPTGNSGLATAGTGDVLAGIIAGLLAQGLETVDAARAGVYVHGLAGDIAAREKGEHGVIARDVAATVPCAIRSLLGGTAGDAFARI